MDLDALMGDVIDADVFLRNLARFLTTEDAVPRLLEAPALVEFTCGHVRPVNRWFVAGDEFFCLVCGPLRVVGLELLAEPIEFPAPDALFDLPVTEWVAEDSQPTKGWDS